VYPSRSAARLMERASATAASALSCRRSIRAQSVEAVMGPIIVRFARPFGRGDAVGVRVLVIQFDADKGIGLLGDPLRELGCELDVRLAPSEPLALDGVDGLIVLGGLADPVDDEPPVRVAASALDEALARAVPTLGICLGAELLAAAAGAGTPRCPPEFGFHTVRLEEAARDDPLLGGLPPAFEVFEAHAYTWEPPAGATVLAHTALTRQAFHLPPVAWGIQFHFESDAATLRHLASSDPTATVFADHGVDLEAFKANAGAITEAWAADAVAIARGFTGVIADRRLAST
jgi:GMP synthase-like glutamine amidotransferase